MTPPIVFSSSVEIVTGRLIGFALTVTHLNTVIFTTLNLFIPEYVASSSFSVSFSQALSTSLWRVCSPVKLNLFLRVLLLVKAVVSVI